MEPLSLLVGFFTQFGYLAVLSVLLACGFGLPVPEDVTLVSGGVISGLGYSNLTTMFLVGLAGVLVGDGLVFVLGRLYGTRVFEMRVIRRFLTPERLKKVEAKLAKHGRMVVFAARFMPGLRTPIFLTTGATRQVSPLTFFALDGVAALISVPLWVYLGYLGAERREWLLSWLERGQTVTIAILVTAVAVLTLNYALKKRDTKKCRVRCKRSILNK